MDENRLSQNWIRVARVGWVLTALVMLALFILGIPHRYNELVAACNATACPFLSLSSGAVAFLEATPFTIQGYATYQITLEVIIALLLTTLALFLFLRFFDSAIGILTTFTLIFIGLNGFVNADDAAAMQFPQAELILFSLNILAGLILPLLVFVFPTGRFVHRSNRWLFMILVIITLMDPIFFQAGFFPGSGDTESYITSDFNNFFFLMVLIIGIGSQIYRYRVVSTAIERQQTKWVLLGLIALITAIAIWLSFVDFFPPATIQGRLLFNIVGVGFVYIFAYLFSISLTIAIVRYNLWGIDVIIRRTLQYSILSGILAAVYFITVALIQNIFSTLGGQPSAVVIVVSTLLIAALFNPLRTRIQRVIDRRFYRSSYDAQAMLARFAETARDEVELEKLTAGLVGGVQETMQPESVSVWIRQTADRGRRSDS